MKPTTHYAEILLLWIAQGFGAGRFPIAPGTLGSALGLLWFFVLLATGNFWLYIAYTLAVLALAVWICTLAERILKQKDPASVVLDEIAALPLCYLGWLALSFMRDGTLRSPQRLFTENWALVLGGFIAFRIFDIWKPWPIRHIQALPGGWGILLDDVLAAIYVNACLGIFGATGSLLNAYLV